MTARLLQADMTERLPFADETFTAVLSDPPYGLSFMGKGWDHGVPGADTWAEVWRVCKPGAVLMAFGGTRTWHRLAVALEDAGWDICDTLMWCYGSGFPKSHDISKAIDKAAGKEREVVGVRRRTLADNPQSGANIPAKPKVGYFEERDGVKHLTAPATPAASLWQGYGTALKPAWEPIILARKPREGTYADGALEHGTGALWIDGGRVELEPGLNMAAKQRKNNIGGGGYKPGVSGETIPTDIQTYKANGRWPANLILDPTSAEMLGEQSGVSKSSVSNRKLAGSNKGGKNALGSFANHLDDIAGHADTGTAARFFYCAKAARGERDAGLDGIEAKRGLVGNKWTDQDYRRGDTEPVVSRRNHHPTVKPIDLCRYLATLLLPPTADATLFVPFSGSGSEVIGALLAGWQNVVGVEKDAEYLDIARARVAWWAQAVAETGESDPRALLKLMRNRRPAPLLEAAQ